VEPSRLLIAGLEKSRKSQPPLAARLLLSNYSPAEMSFRSTPAINLHTVEIVLEVDVAAAVKSELLAGGLEGGDIYVGAVTNTTDALYLLWHGGDRAPFSTMINRRAMATPAAARASAFQFLLKLRQRPD